MKRLTKIVSLLALMSFLLGTFLVVNPDYSEANAADDHREWCLDQSAIGEPCGGLPLDCICYDTIVVTQEEK